MEEIRMFWKDTKGLKHLSPSAKIGLTAFVLIAGIGYLFGFFNIYLTYNSLDQNPGLSIKDIQMAFYGARDITALEKSVDGSMREYFQTDKDHNTTKDWVQAGGKEEDFAPVQAIFEVSCNMCHSAELKVADVVTADYEHVKDYLVQDTGKSVSRLVSISHTHILATLAIIFILTFIFSFSRYPEWVKIIVITFSYLALVIDVGSWWLAKLAPFFSVFVILGGASLGCSFFLLVVLPLYDMWLRKGSAQSQA